MLGNIILGMLIIVEIVFMVFSLQKKSNLRREKSIVRIILAGTFFILILTPIIKCGFQWFMLSLVLTVQALLGIVVLVRRKENSISKKDRIIFSGLNRILLIVMAMMPVLIFPQYSPIKPTGSYQVGASSYTLTDTSREEYFTKVQDNRKITIQYWYPIEKSGQKEVFASGKFPLVVFSHGAFGYRMSNYSTYQELASHGYIVCSIDHTHHAFMTKQEDGKTVIANFGFINSAMGAANGDISAEETYKLEQEWMKLRTGDMSFVLDYIKKASASNTDEIYKSMDLEHIGVFGHSLGGATAAQIGRTDKDVDAVAVIDGTMLGEITGFENGRDVITNVPYPKPIINFYNQSHYYDEAVKDKDNYPNLVATKNALDSYTVVVKGSGHMNFTDLAIVSPFLSKMLGGLGDVDPRYCIETLNKDILQFFDHYLKSSNVEIPRERIQ